MKPDQIGRRSVIASVLAAIPSFPRPLQESAQRGIPSGSQLGTEYPVVQSIADHSPLELSFLQDRFGNLAAWQKMARARLFDLLHYTPAKVDFAVQPILRKEHDGYIEEQFTFQSTPHTRVPATLLIPKGGKGPWPGIVALHDHGGFYLWGREKLNSTENEHAELTKFKADAYGGLNIANELVKQGYAVITIDMFYWGDRRYLIAEDPESWKKRPADMTAEDIRQYNRRSSQNEQLMARAILTSGATWPGIMLWDDLRTVDYLASRPEIDAKRLGCVGLSVGGYRSFVLAALDSRIKAAVDVGWMTTFGAQIEKHIINTMGQTFTIPGMYRYFDLPDLAALIAPRAVMVQMGSQDKLFPQPAIQAAFEKIRKCYQKAGSADHQKCLLYNAPHQFNREMQPVAWEWLRQWV